MEDFDHTAQASPSGATMDPPIVAASTAARRRAKAPAPKGVSLDLEDEVEFGSDEDLMENIGEIQVPITNEWYPGKPDSPPKNPSKKNRFKSSSESRSGLLGGRREKEKAKTKGIGDARLVLPPLPPNPSSSTFNATNSNGHSRQNSEQSYSSSARTGATGMTDVSVATGLTSMTSMTRLENLKKEKEKSRSKVFGKLFGKKKNDQESTASRSIASESVESFGMTSQYSETSQPRSILITNAHLPPNHTPTSRASADPSSSSSAGQNTSSLRRTNGHVSQPSANSTTPLIKETKEPSLRSSVDHSESHNTFSSSDQPPSLKVSATSHILAHMSSDGCSDVGTDSRDRIENKHLSAVSGTSATPSSDSRPSVASTQSSTAPAFLLSGSDSIKTRLPPFPASELDLNSLTILSTTVMRRISNSTLSDHRIGGNHHHSSTALGSKKSIWQSHQLVLTAFRMDPRRPSHQGEEENGLIRQQPTTQTIAHLHLFAYHTQPKSPAKPSYYENSGSANPGPRKFGSLEGAEKVEVERQQIGMETTAGVWESSSGDDHESASRKWVLRVRFSNDEQEWLCDMPTGDTLFEWVRQIKAYATVIKAESMSYGPASHTTHPEAVGFQMGQDLREQALLHSSQISRAASRDHSPASVTERNVKSPSKADMYRAAIQAKEQADESAVSHPPVGINDFLARTVAGPRGQDLATFLDGADLEWRLQEAERIRQGSVVSTSETLSEEVGQHTLPSRSLSRVRSHSNRPSINHHVLPNEGGLSRSTSISSHGAKSGGLPPSPVKGSLFYTSPTSSKTSGIPPRTGRPPAVPPPKMGLPPVPPPTAPLPPLPSVPTLGPALPVRPEDPATPVSPAYIVTPNMTPPQTTFDFPRPPMTPGMGDEEGRDPLPESPLNTQLAGFTHLAIDPSQKDILSSSQNSTRKNIFETEGNGNGANSGGGDQESISSKSSSARLRRIKRPLPAMDLMAELSARREMNYEKPQTMQEDDTPIDEDRPRRIRFV